MGNHKRHFIPIAITPETRRKISAFTRSAQVLPTGYSIQYKQKTNFRYLLVCFNAICLLSLSHQYESSNFVKFFAKKSTICYIVSMG